MSYLDELARCAAADARLNAIKIHAAMPELSDAEFHRIVAGLHLAAFRDHLAAYDVGEALAAFENAVKALSQESGQQPDIAEDEESEYGLSPRGAAELLHRRRTGR